MAASFRIIDTGVREGRANIAFDAALIEERQAGNVPDTIRFLSFPPTALIGRHQDLRAEVDPAFACNSFNPQRPQPTPGDDAPVFRHDLAGAN